MDREIEEKAEELNKERREIMSRLIGSFIDVFEFEVKHSLESKKQIATDITNLLLKALGHSAISWALGIDKEKLMEIYIEATETVFKELDIELVKEMKEHTG